MIERNAQGIRFTPRFPLIYLDHCSLRELAKTSAWRAKFRSIIERKGTLLFSWINLTEASRNTGRSSAEVRDFLNELGPHWMFLDSNFGTVADGEANGIRPVEVFQPWPLVVPFLAHLGDRPLLLGTAIEVVQDASYKRVRDDWYAFMDYVAKRVREQRRLYKIGAELVPPEAGPTRPSQHCAQALVNQLIQDGKNVRANDINDLMHTAVPINYAHWIVLDKTWADYVRRLKLGRKDLHVYPVSQLPTALEDLETLEVLDEVVLPWGS